MNLLMKEAGLGDCYARETYDDGVGAPDGLAYLRLPILSGYDVLFVEPWLETFSR